MEIPALLRRTLDRVVPADAPPAPPEAGDVVAGYALLRPLGHGASARVWLGRHEVSGGLAALKLLARDDARAARDLFERERRALLRLRHPNIIPVFDVGDDCIVTAYVEGVDLRQRLRTPMAPADAVEIACVVGSALASAHEAGVVHCDVKPANILLDRQRTPFLADFGISHLLEDDDDVDLVGGTPAYMAPEQAAGDLSPAADQYGLARTLLAMLLGGTPPRDSDTALDQLDDDATAILGPILERALADEPRDRYPGVADFVAALRQVELPAVARVRRRVAAVRSAEPFAWAAHPVRVERITEQIDAAHYRMSELVAAGVVDADAWRDFCESTGHDDFGWSVYARSERLGPLTEPEALARMRECVVLAHGLFVTRDVWRDVAVGIARDNATAIALTPDLLGFGESTFAPRGRAPACSPAGLARSVRDWLALIGLAETPTVMLGHSFSGGALLCVRDQDLGAATRRIAVTPALFSSSRVRQAWSLAHAASVFVLSVFPHVLTRVIARWRFRADPSLQNTLVSVRDEMARAAERLGWRRCARLMWVAGLARPAPADELRNCIVVTTPDDPLVPDQELADTLDKVGIPAARHYSLNYGGHFPQLVDERRPEWGARNVHELVSVVDGVMELTVTGSSSQSPPDSDGLDTTRPLPPR